MADQTIEIRLILRDEISKAMEDAFTKMRRHDSGFTTQRGRQELERFGGAVRVVHRELSTLARISLGGLVGGGLVAGIYQAAKALQEMSRQGMQLHYTAQSLGVQTSMLEKYSDAMMAVGQSNEQGRQGIENAIGALRDLQTQGNKSSVWGALEKAKGGKQFLRELMAEINGPRGPEGALRMLLQRMQDTNPEGQRLLAKTFDLGTTGAKDLLDILPLLNKRVELSVPQMKALALANANFEISIGNVGRQLGVALMPGLTKVTEAFDKWLQTDAGKKVIADLGEWATDVSDAIAKWIGDQGPNGLNANIEELKKGVELLKTAFGVANTVIEAMGITWPQLIGGVVAIHFGAWLLSVAFGLARIAPYVAVLTALAAAANITRNVDPESSGNTARDLLSDLLRSLGIDVPKEGGGTTRGTSPTGPKEGEGFWDYVKRQLLEGIGMGATPQQQSGDETPKNEGQRRADLDEKRRNDKELTSEFKTLAYDLTKLNDRLMPGGPEGGKGPSGFQNDLGPGAFQTMMKGGVFADQYQTVVDAAEKHGVPPSLMASILAFETGYGKSGKSQPPFNNPAGLMGGGLFNREHMKFATLAEGIDKAGEVQKRIYERGGRAIAGMAPIYAPVGAKNDPHRTNAQWPGSVTKLQNRLTDPGFDPGGLQGATYSGFDPGGLQDAVPGVGSLKGPSPITNSLAQRDTINGTATIDIDVGGIGQSERDPDALFPPRPLGGAVQMQNTPRVENNPQSFQ